MILILLEINILDTFTTAFIWILGFFSVIFLIIFVGSIFESVNEYRKKRDPKYIASIIKKKIMNCESIDWVKATGGYEMTNVHTLFYELDEEELVEAVVGYMNYNFNIWVNDLDDEHKSLFSQINNVNSGDIEHYITNIGKKVIDEIKNKKNAKGILEAYRGEHHQKKDNGTPENANQEITDVEKTLNDYQIAEGRLTDFTKIMRAMYQCGIIQPARKETGLNKDNCIKAIGNFLGVEFKTEPKQLINAAKNNTNYFDVFKDLKDNAL